jgi:hypothetical protein
MRIIAWNSEGDKWGPFWTSVLAPALTNYPDESIIGLLVEASWPPWMVRTDNALVELKDSAIVNFVWREDDDPVWVPGRRSTFCTAMHKVRSRTAFSVPWVAHLDANTNSRCSMGAAFLLRELSRGSTWRYLKRGDFEFTRPVVHAVIDRGPITKLVVLHVHLVSSRNAVAELHEILNMASTMIPEGAYAILVGDLNVNIRGRSTADVTQDLDAPGWRPLRSDDETQRSHGELDWAVLFDPKNNLPASGRVLYRFDSIRNPAADHSVMVYTLPGI